MRTSKIRLQKELDRFAAVAHDSVAIESVESKGSVDEVVVRLTCPDGTTYAGEAYRLRIRVGDNYVSFAVNSSKRSLV